MLSTTMLRVANFMRIKTNRVDAHRNAMGISFSLQLLLLQRPWLVYYRLPILRADLESSYSTSAC